MTAEDKWTKTICDLINSKYKNKFDKNIYFDVQIHVPYAYEILNYKLDVNTLVVNPDVADSLFAQNYATDLLIYENNEGVIKPRVIIESKLGKVTTHDTITYSEKALEHKNVTRYIRYGIMIGDRKEYPLPGRLYRHGVNFDFMISFKKETPNDDEMKRFIDTINEEIKASKDFEEMIYSSKNKDREKYTYLHKPLRIE